jgi:ligand-binding sensor domain-containing protein
MLGESFQNSHRYLFGNGENRKASLVPVTTICLRNADTCDEEFVHTLRRTGSLAAAFTVIAAHTLAWSSSALDPSKSVAQYVHDVWTTENGLPQNSVGALAQTPDGYLWIGTEEGLVRFDGARFVTFDKRNTPSLQSSEVDALLVDQRGVLWIGMRGGGIVSYNGDSFRAFTT